MRPYIRDYVFCGATTAGAKATLDAKAGDLLVAFHVNYSTTARFTDGVDLGTAIGTTMSDGWNEAGGTSRLGTWVRAVTSDFTVTLGPGISYTAGTYGTTQVVLALRGVKYCGSLFLPESSGYRGSLTVDQSGRPCNWLDTSSSRSPILTSDLGLDGGPGVLSIGAWLWTSQARFGMGSWEPAESAETLLIWDDCPAWRHTCVAVAWHDAADITVSDGATSINFAGNNTGNTTGSNPAVAGGVSFVIVPEDYEPTAGELAFGERVTSATAGDTLTVDATAGDYCLFATACQYGSQGDHTPDGWTGVYGDTESDRSGTVAVKKITEKGTVSVTVPTPTGGRIAASLAAITGLDSLTPQPWVDGPPTLPDGPCLVLVNANAVYNASNATLDQTTDVIVDHEETRSGSDSWTGCGIYYVADGGGAVATFTPTTSTTFTAWAVIPLSSGGDVPSGLPTLCMGDGTVVTLVGWWDGTQLLPAEFVGV